MKPPNRAPLIAYRRITKAGSIQRVRHHYRKVPPHTLR